MGQQMNRPGGAVATRVADALPRHSVPGNDGTSTMPGHDRRAEGHERLVSLSRDCVRIDRRVAGVAMRVAVPVRAYAGVALSLLPGAIGYQIHLLHRDDELSVTLDTADDDAEILATWRLWSRFFRLPALVERRPGQIEPADEALGGLTLGAAGPVRRPTRGRARRRPRFLARRKSGDPALAGSCHRDEREIIARD